MNKSLIKQKVTDALQLENPIITNIQRTPGGLTNDSFFAMLNNEGIVVRIAGKGTEVLVNRKEEKDNLVFSTKLGINPPLLYFNEQTGFKITKKIKNAIAFTPALAREEQTMQQIIHVFKHLHNTDTPMKNEFKLFDLIKHYESLIHDINHVIYEKLANLKEDIIRLQAIYETFQIKQTPSHIDPVCANILKSSNEKIYLIDWEYSAMFDPLWDLATLFVSLELQENEQLFFLTHYLGRRPTKNELQRILMHTIFQDYLWILWTYFKEFQGDDTGDSIIIRTKRATKNIALYNKVYKEHHVI